MIRAIFLFVVLGLGLFAGTQFAGQQGYVLISVAGTTTEMSVTTLVVLVIALLALLFGLEFLLKKSLHASSRTWNWFSVRKLKKARRQTNEGILKLLEGDWQMAERKVTRLAEHHDMPLLCYLIASEAAQGMGDTAKRDRYLELAAEQEHAGLAVALTKAKQQIQEGQYPLALETLSVLKVQHANNPIVLNLLKSVYVHLEQWQPLLELLPKLTKVKQVSLQEQQQLEEQAHCGILAEIAADKGSAGLMAHWNTLSRRRKKEPDLLVNMVNLLIERHADEEAFRIVQDVLKKNPDDTLLKLLPEMDLPDTSGVISLLESVLKKDTANAMANSVLAQFYMREKQWDKAQQYLEKALSVRADVTDYAYLADALEQQNMSQAAGDVSRQALTLLEARR
ncbi:heme biosynthesis protein HemY [Vibrio sp. HA2012]|uniref:heme biosynthesis protein HemY n=1 Tax=Vibrio sp. HA2012 TaxID=1971595 RepID=UPI000C2BFD2C|nr:heme biosynthesis HemY N-terminal domain-containing protein [Vibrio sp. HA2012]PJC84985.1 heme biosynthesis protein HemY [Vibrio sp. HA2012]